jgi:hypothetical protein
MTDTIFVKNDFSQSTDRELEVYQHSSGETVSIPYSPESERKKRFPFVNQDDYLKIRMKDHPAELPPCKIELLSGRVHSLDRGERSRTDITESDDATTKTYHISSGPPTWKLTIQSHLTSRDRGDEYGDQGEENVTVGDDGPGGGG